MDLVKKAPAAYFTTIQQISNIQDLFNLQNYELMSSDDNFLTWLIKDQTTEEFDNFNYIIATRR